MMVTPATQVRRQYVANVTGPAHAPWQERIDRERQHLNRSLLRGRRSQADASANLDKVPALHNTHRSFSTPEIMRTVDELMVSQGLLPASSFRRKQLRSAGSGAALSMRSGESSLSGVTTASVRKQVRDAIQQELDKVVLPLQERIRAERTENQRLDEELRGLTGDVAVLQ